MKISIFAGLILTSTVIASCGGSEENKENEEKKITVCECVKMGDEMMKEAEQVGDDQEKLKAIEEKYKETADKCRELGKEAENNPERMKELENEIKKCD